MTFFIVGVEGLDISYKYKLEKLDTEAERSKAGGAVPPGRPSGGRELPSPPIWGRFGNP